MLGTYMESRAAETFGANDDRGAFFTAGETKSSDWEVDINSDRLTDLMMVVNRSTHVTLVGSG